MHFENFSEHSHTFGALERVCCISSDSHQSHISEGELLWSLRTMDGKSSPPEKKAKELRQPMNIGVADGGRNLVAHVRMDGAWLGSIDILINKAFTSRAFDINTKDLAKYSQSGGQFFGIHAFNGGRMMIICRRCAIAARRQCTRSHRRERWFRRAGPSRRGSRRTGIRVIPRGVASHGK